MGHFSDRLHAALRSLVWSQADLSRRIPVVSPPQLSRYLSGAFSPELGTLDAILQALPQAKRPEVLMGYVLDHIPASQAKLLVIRPKDVPDEDNDVRNWGRAARGSELAENLLDLEKVAVLNPDVAMVIKHMVRSYQRKRYDFHEGRDPLASEQDTGEPE